MTQKPIISCDSICDLPASLIAAHGIHIIPAHISQGSNNWLDDGSIAPSGLYRLYQETGELPKTAAFPPHTALSLFEPAAEKGQEVVHISVSSNISSCAQNAMIAASALKGVYVVDSRSLSSGIGLLVLEACRLRWQGLSAAEIARNLEAFRDKVSVSFVVDTLEYLQKGGRCSSLAAMGANLLNLKPCLEVRDGEIKVGKKYRGKIQKAVKDYLSDMLGRGEADTGREVFITHSGGFADDELEAAMKHAVEVLGKEDVRVCQAGCTIASHCGPRTLGVIFARK